MSTDAGLRLRIFRQYEWIPRSDGRLGCTINYVLQHKDVLQYKTDEKDDWKPVPIAHGEKPPHPEDIRRNKQINETVNSLDEMIKNGIIRL